MTFLKILRLSEIWGSGGFGLGGGGGGGGGCPFLQQKNLRSHQFCLEKVLATLPPRNHNIGFGLCK